MRRLELLHSALLPLGRRPMPCIRPQTQAPSEQVQQAYLDSLPLFTEVLLSWQSSQKGLFLGLGKQAGCLI